MTFENLLALGFIPALFITGHWVLGKLFDDKPEALDSVSRLAAGAIVGIALWLPLVIATAWLGIYQPSWIGAAGWIASGLGIARLRSRLRFSTDAAGAIALCVAAAAFVWNSHYATESLQGGRDQGVYSNHALLIAKSGNLRSPPIFETQFTEEHYHLARGNQAGGYYFDTTNRNIHLQFPPTFAALLAQGYGTAGFRGLFAVNPFLSALNALLLFALLRSAVSNRWALLGTLVFILNVIQFWNTRVTLSEILCQSYLLAGILVASRAAAQNAKGAFALGCSLIALNASVRVDGFLALAGISAAVLLARLLLPNETSKAASRTFRWGVTAALATSLACLAYNRYSSPGYFFALSDKIYLLVAFGAILAVVAMLPFPASLRRKAISLLSHPAIFWSCTGLVLAALCYAAFVRPTLEPFATLPNDHPQAGERDFRENSLVDLAAYLSTGLIVVAAGGALLTLRALLRQTLSPLLMLLGVWLLFTVLYLYNPAISPDHIWRMRRFSPIVTPGFIAFATVGAAWLISKIRAHELRILASFALLVLMGAHLVKTGKTLAFTALNDGFAQLAEDVASAIPAGSVVIASVDKPTLGPLQLARDYEIIRGHPNYPPHRTYVPQLAERLKAEGRTVYILSPENVFSPQAAAKGASFELAAKEIVPSFSPFPIELRDVVYHAYLAPMGDRFIGYAADDARIVIGANPILGVEESGMQGQERNGEQPFRWTGEQATFSMPWNFNRDPIGATLTIGGAKPGGSRLRLIANGRVIIDQDILDSGSTIELPLESFDWNVDQLNLALESTPWIPAKLVEGSTDDRILGVQLYGIEFQFERDDLIANVEFGHSRIYGIAESGVHDSERIDGELYRWTDGDARFQFELKPGFSPQRLSLQLRSAPPDSKSLRLIWNGTTLYETDSLSPPQTIEVELPESVTSSRVVELRIESDTFVPAETEEGSKDDRKLGVMIGRIQLEGDTAKR